jgi:Na+-translocating ferredoxin:NAD+ oxidoreductase subunit A
VVYAIGAALGFSLVMVLFAALRERLEHAPVPGAVPRRAGGAGQRRHPVAGFMGFAGLTG